MSIKSRLEALEAVRGGVTSLKIVMCYGERVYGEGYPNAILTEDADGNFFYEDGTPLHGDTREENTQTIIIMRDD